MLKNKIAAAGMAGMLAMSLGLVACGGNNSAASATSAEATSAEATSAAADATSAAADSAAVDSAAAAATTSAADAAAAEAPVYWEGTLADGSEVTYSEDIDLDVTTLIINSADLSDIKMWVGPATADGDKFTITDTGTNETISFTIADVAADGTLTLNIDGYGEVQLKGVTQAEFDAQLQEAIELLGTVGELADEATSAAAAE